MRVETLIIAATGFALACIVVGTAGILRQLARASTPARRVSLWARYRRGRHHHPTALARLLDAYLTSTRELVAARALLTGADPW